MNLSKNNCYHYLLTIFVRLIFLFWTNNTRILLIIHIFLLTYVHKYIILFLYLTNISTTYYSPSVTIRHLDTTSLDTFQFNIRIRHNRLTSPWITRGWVYHWRRKFFARAWTFLTRTHMFVCWFAHICKSIPLRAHCLSALIFRFRN